MLHVVLLICNMATAECTIQTARSYYTIETESFAMSGCAMYGLMASARLSELYDHTTERVVVQCPDERRK